MLSQLAYCARADQVSDVWVGGRHQLENGRLAQINYDELVARADEWAARITSLRS